MLEKTLEESERIFFSKVSIAYFILTLHKTSVEKMLEKHISHVLFWKPMPFKQSHNILYMPIYYCMSFL